MNEKKKIRRLPKRIISFALTLAMMLTLMPGMNVAVYADSTPNHLTFTAVEAGSTIQLGASEATNIQYSTDGGINWSAYNFSDFVGQKITLADAGDKVSFKGENISTNFDHHFKMTGKIAASGSVTSLLDGNGNNPDVILHESCFSYLFHNCKSLTSAPELPATTEDIRNMVSDYIRRENRSEIIPQPKEVNCHREVAKMILNTIIR